MEYLAAFLIGFLVSIGTSFVLGINKAKNLPGGSLASGLILSSQTDINIFLACLLGLTGHLAFVFLVSQTNKK